ncbi:hypothetical protein [Deinococcus apachensis]|uniref:hypothetical protein n=1 Tax=Deinococcus apachensis TaxID=309886 RepID=UPI000363EF79|nr:hypothetical protein [Deinococcus apachensis]
MTILLAVLLAPVIVLLAVLPAFLALVGVGTALAAAFLLTLLALDWVFPGWLGCTGYETREDDAEQVAYLTARGQ